MVDLLDFDELDLSDLPDDDHQVVPEPALGLCQVEAELELSLELCHDSFLDSRALSLYLFDRSILSRERCFTFLVLACSTFCWAETTATKKVNMHTFAMHDAMPADDLRNLLLFCVERSRRQPSLLLSCCCRCLGLSSTPP